MLSILYLLKILAVTFHVDAIILILDTRTQRFRIVTQHQSQDSSPSASNWTAWVLSITLPYQWWNYFHSPLAPPWSFSSCLLPKWQQSKWLILLNFTNSPFKKTLHSKEEMFVPLSSDFALDITLIHRAQLSLLQPSL